MKIAAKHRMKFQPKNRHSRLPNAIRLEDFPSPFAKTKRWQKIENMAEIIRVGNADNIKKKILPDKELQSVLAQTYFTTRYSWR